MLAGLIWSVELKSYSSSVMFIRNLNGDSGLLPMNSTNPLGEQPPSWDPHKISRAFWPLDGFWTSLIR